MKWLVQMIGVGLVILALLDIYLTVLYPRLGSSILSVLLTQGIWQLFRFAARTVPFRGDCLLSHCGSTTIIAIVVVWVSLLICGFALLVWPELRSKLTPSQEAFKYQ
jgi:hypothetical protein